MLPFNAQNSGDITMTKAPLLVHFLHSRRVFPYPTTFVLKMILFGVAANCNETEIETIDDYREERLQILHINDVVHYTYCSSQCGRNDPDIITS